MLISGLEMGTDENHKIHSNNYLMFTHQIDHSPCFLLQCGREIGGKDEKERRGGGGRMEKKGKK